MDSQFRNVGSGTGAPQITKQKVRDLLQKAEEFLVALDMETGIKTDPKTMRALQLALLEDFVEVHNSARRSDVPLPEDKDQLNRLLFDEAGPGV